MGNRAEADLSFKVEVCNTAEFDFTIRFSGILLVTFCDAVHGGYQEEKYVASLGTEAITKIHILLYTLNALTGSLVIVPHAGNDERVC